MFFTCRPEANSGFTALSTLYLVGLAFCTKNASKIVENTAEKTLKNVLTRAVPCDTINFALTQEACLRQSFNPLKNKVLQGLGTLKTEQ